MKPQLRAPLHRHRSGYTQIPGSARLSAQHDTDAALARTVVRDAFVPLLTDVLDRLALDQEPEELVVYLHLYRLAVGDERNGCRVSRADLERRCRMSQLRLGKALAGLVHKGHVSLVDRNRAGTLYRVHLPHEVFGESAHEAVLHLRAPMHPAAVDTKLTHTMPAPQKSAPQKSAPQKSAPQKSAPQKSAPQKSAPQKSAPQKSAPQKSAHDEHADIPTASVGTLAQWFVAQRKASKGRSDDVLDEILAAVEDGVALPQLHAHLVAFLAEMPKQTPISELGRFIARRTIDVCR